MNSIIILAQTGSGFGDFVRQIPIGPIITLCLSGILLVVAAVFIVRARTGRKDEEEKKRRAQPAFVPAAAPVRPQTRSTNLNDLPDLDLLVDDVPTQAPVPKPAPAAPARAAKPGMFTVNVNDGGSAQAVEVVTILRDVVDGGLIIQMGDKTYRDLGNDETFRNSFLKIMRELSPIVTQAPQPAEKQPAPAPEPAITPEPDTGAIEDLPDVRDLIEEPPAAAPATPKPAPPPTVGGQMPGDLPKFSLEQEPQTIKTRGGLLGRTKTEFVPVPELDIAGAIEAYLQHKLQNTPDYAGRSIHVHPAEDGGVAIEVDGTHYEAVGDVADDDVRNFLSATIQEWQQRHSS